MGHVDHGKTTLLDKIRQSNIAASESGGITQHIGASQVSFKTKENEIAQITFIDTPGHAAFAQMRARGASVTDIALLVIAADEGVKEQTKESLAHIQNAKVPFLIAVTKIDLPSASLDMVKGQLVEADIVPEDYGGKVTVIPVSGKTGEGIADLLEMLLLMGKIEDLKADPDAFPEGVIIESYRDSRSGPAGTLLIKNGTLRLRQEVWIGKEKLKIKAMFDDQGKPVSEATPSQPVKILGFKEIPLMGSTLSPLPPQTAKESQEEKKDDETELIFKEKEKKLPLLIKSDAQGTLEAILNNLPVEAEVIYSGVGEVNDSDVFLAQATGAAIFSFRVKVPNNILKLGEENAVLIKNFSLVHELLEEAERAVLRMLEPGIEREIIGKAQVIAEFEIDKKRIAGCRVLQGEIRRNLPVTIRRGNETPKEAKITSMKHLKDDIETAKKDQDFGAFFSPAVDFQKGDVIISYKD